MRASKITGILFATIAGATLLGGVILAGAASGGPIAANPTLHAALGLGWMLGLWASFAVFLTFMTAVLVENLDEQPTTSSEETRRVLEIVPPRSHDARTDARIGGDIVKVG